MTVLEGPAFCVPKDGNFIFFFFQRQKWSTCAAVMQTLDEKQHVLLFEVGSHGPLATPKLSTQQKGP